MLFLPIGVHYLLGVPWLQRHEMGILAQIRALSNYILR
jgi:hypothetical protein